MAYSLKIVMKKGGSVFEFVKFLWFFPGGCTLEEIEAIWTKGDIKKNLTFLKENSVIYSNENLYSISLGKKKAKIYKLNSLIVNTLGQKIDLKKKIEVCSQLTAFYAKKMDRILIHIGSLNTKQSDISSKVFLNMEMNLKHLVSIMYSVWAV